MSHLSEDEYGVTLTWNTEDGLRSWELQSLPFDAKYETAGQATVTLRRNGGDPDYVIARIPSIAVARKLEELFRRTAELMGERLTEHAAASQHRPPGVHLQEDVVYLLSDYGEYPY